MNDEEFKELSHRAAKEFLNGGAGKASIQLEIDLITTVHLVGQLQIALRHPKNVGLSAQTSRRVIDQIIVHLRSLGFPATADVAALGDDPDCDGRVVDLPPEQVQ